MSTKNKNKLDKNKYYVEIINFLIRKRAVLRERKNKNTEERNREKDKKTNEVERETDIP
jgi:hypothetical protein